MTKEKTAETLRMFLAKNNTTLRRVCMENDLPYNTIWQRVNKNARVMSYKDFRDLVEAVNPLYSVVVENDEFVIEKRK